MSLSVAKFLIKASKILANAEAKAKINEFLKYIDDEEIDVVQYSENIKIHIKLSSDMEQETPEGVSFNILVNMLSENEGDYSLDDTMILPCSTDAELKNLEIKEPVGEDMKTPFKGELLDWKADAVKILQQKFTKERNNWLK